MMSSRVMLLMTAVLASLLTAGGCVDNLKNPPKPAEEYYKDGDFYYTKGNFYRALTMYSQAINKNGNFAAAWAGFGDVHRELAVVDFQNAAKEKAANEHLVQSKWAFENALKRDSGLSRAVYGMGKLYYEKSVHLADAPVWKEEGKAYATPEDRKAWARKGVESLKRALAGGNKQEEFYRWSHRYLGILYTVLGRFPEAREAFTIFQQYSRETMDFLQKQKPPDEKEKTEVETRMMVLRKDMEDVDALIADLEKRQAAGGK